MVFCRSTRRVLWKQQGITEILLYLLLQVPSIVFLVSNLPTFFDNGIMAMQVAALQVGTESVFSFWVGTDFSTQAHILEPEVFLTFLTFCTLWFSKLTFWTLWFSTGINKELLIQDSSQPVLIYCHTQVGSNS